MTLTSLLRTGAAFVGFGAIFLGSLAGLSFPAVFATAGIAWAILVFAGPAPSNRLEPA